MGKEHQYKTIIVWTGSKGQGTIDYRSYSRDHSIFIENKATIFGSSDPAFRGDRTKHNPEELFVSSLSVCHMLSYLHLCADSGITVVEYKDEAKGIMQETEEGGGHFTEVILHPTVTITDKTKIDEANNLHFQANKLCFIASSCNFPVRHKPVCKLADQLVTAMNNKQ